MAKNECEARQRDRLRNQTTEQPEIIIDPMPKMAEGLNGIKELLGV